MSGTLQQLDATEAQKPLKRCLEALAQNHTIELRLRDGITVKSTPPPTVQKGLVVTQMQPDGNGRKTPKPISGAPDEKLGLDVKVIVRGAEKKDEHEYIALDPEMIYVKWYNGGKTKKGGCSDVKETVEKALKDQNIAQRYDETEKCYFVKPDANNEKEIKLYAMFTDKNTKDKC